MCFNKILLFPQVRPCSFLGSLRWLSPVDEIITCTSSVMFSLMFSLPICKISVTCHLFFIPVCYTMLKKRTNIGFRHLLVLVLDRDDLCKEQHIQSSMLVNVWVLLKLNMGLLTSPFLIQTSSQSCYMCTTTQEVRKCFHVNWNFFSSQKDSTTFFSWGLCFPFDTLKGSTNNPMPYIDVMATWLLFQGFIHPSNCCHLIHCEETLMISSKSLAKHGQNGYRRFLSTSFFLTFLHLVWLWNI